MRKPGAPREIPPPLELECLKVLWGLGEASVKQVHEELEKKQRLLAYTTVLTVLDRLETRKAVERRKQGRAFYYAPVLNIERARRTAVRELADTYFGGSYDLLREYLASPDVETPLPPLAESEETETAPGAALEQVEPELDTTLL